MNPIIKEGWIDALRSGEYEQEDGTLKGEKGFCCLGVLMNEIEGAELNDYDEFEYQDEIHSSQLPDVLRDALEIMDWQLRHLMKANDAVKYQPYPPEEGEEYDESTMVEHVNDFDDIADWIEDNL
jgi:hypothetical protein